MGQGKGGALAAYLRRSWPAAVILLLATAVFAGLYGYAHSGTAEEQQRGEAYVEYETGRVLEILSDSCEPDAEADGAYRGDQSLLVAVTSGQYRGQTLYVQCRWAAVRRASGLRGPCDAADLHLCRWKPQCHRV